MQKIDKLLESLLLKEKQLEGLKRENVVLTEILRKQTEEKNGLLEKLEKQITQIKFVHELEKKIEKYEFILQIEKYKETL